MNTKLLVNGKLVKGKGDEQNVLNPATGKVIAQVGEADESQITAAVSGAAKAFPGWAATVPKDRATLLMKLADRIEAEGKEFAAQVRGASQAIEQAGVRSRAEGSMSMEAMISPPVIETFLKNCCFCFVFSSGSLSFQKG